MKRLIKAITNTLYSYRYNPEKNKGMSVAYNGLKTEFRKERLSFLESASLFGGQNWYKFLKRGMTGSRSWEYMLAAQLIDYSPTDVVLDVGAYNTYFCNYLANQVCCVYAIDNFYWSKRDYVVKHHHELTPEEWIAKVKSSGYDNLIIEDQDIENLKYPDNYFDKIMNISTIEHVKDDEAAFKEMYRVLKPDGKLVLTTEMHLTKPQPYIEVTKTGEERYYRIYSYKTLLALLTKTGFKLTGKDYLEETLEKWRDYEKTAAILCLDKSS